MTFNSDTRLTDTLEREILAEALNSQYNYSPIRSIQKLVSKMIKLREKGLVARGNASVGQMQ
jgi:hypothetical protein